MSALRDVVRLAAELEKGSRENECRATNSLYGSPREGGGVVGLRDVFLFLASGINLDALADVLRVRESRALVRAVGISVLRHTIDTVDSADAKVAILQFSAAALSCVVHVDAVVGQNFLLWCHPLSVSVSVIVQINDGNRSGLSAIVSASRGVKARGALAMDRLREEYAVLDDVVFSKFELRNIHVFHNLSGCRVEHLDAITVEATVLRDSLCRNMRSSVPVDVLLSCLTVLATEVRVLFKQNI